jgi:hypothetical protein
VFANPADGLNSRTSVKHFIAPQEKRAERETLIKKKSGQFERAGRY